MIDRQLVTQLLAAIDDSEVDIDVMLRPELIVRGTTAKPPPTPS